jgi:SAM-dependent methyltransferase
MTTSARTIPLVPQALGVVRGAAQLAKLAVDVARETAVQRRGRVRAWLTPPPGIHGTEWARYLWDQWGHTRGKRRKDPAFRVAPSLEQIRRLCPDLGPSHRVLDLGPRNWKEVAMVRAAGLGAVEALDLFPHDPRIRRGDMHRMPFADGEFDLVFATHVLEHAYEPRRALAEVTRVLKPGGRLWVQLPREFVPGRKDRINYDCATSMLAMFPRPANVTVVWDDTQPNWFRALFRVGP